MDGFRLCVWSQQTYRQHKKHDVQLFSCLGFYVQFSVSSKKERTFAVMFSYEGNYDRRGGTLMG